MILTMTSHCIMSYWKRLYIFEIMKQNHFKWCMCMDLSHDVQILLKGFWGILCRDFSISIMHCDVIFIHLHIKRFLISEEVSDLWRSCEKLLFIISKVFFNSESLFFKLNSLLHMYFKLEQFDNFKICQLTYKFAHVNILTQSINTRIGWDINCT